MAERLRGPVMRRLVATVLMHARRTPRIVSSTPRREAW